MEFGEENRQPSLRLIASKLCLVFAEDYDQLCRDNFQSIVKSLDQKNSGAPPLPENRKLYLYKENAFKKR